MWLCLMMGMVMWLVAIGVREWNVDDVAVLIKTFVEANNPKMMLVLNIFLLLFQDDRFVDMVLLPMLSFGPPFPILHLQFNLFRFEDFILEGASQLLMMHRPPPINCHCY